MGQSDQELVGRFNYSVRAHLAFLQGRSRPNSFSDSAVPGGRSTQIQEVAVLILTRAQVHILNESRGSTLEVVISRMKVRGSDVRLVLVSATVPNIDDVAAWTGGSDGGPAKVFEVSQNLPTSLVQITDFRNLLTVR